MGLIMELEPAAANVSKKETPEHSSDDSSEEEEEEEEEESEEETRRRPQTDAEIFKYRWCRWPEVVGMDAAEAKRIIRVGKPDIWFEVMSERQLQTLCYRARRVRLIVDRYNRVVQVPHVG